jgi:hypothetical protein
MTIHPFLHPQPVTDIRNVSDASIAFRRVWETIYPLRKGKIECVAELTLTANAASTLFKYIGLSKQSVLVFDPLTSNAALEKANGTLFVTLANRTKDQFTVTHANNSQTDRSYLVAIIG